MSKVSKAAAASSMDVALAAIKAQDSALYKRSRVDLRGDERLLISAVSTGSIVLNHLIGGTQVDGNWVCPGYPRGRITEIYGGESSGKSTLGVHACAEAVRSGGSAAYIDYEHTFSHSYAQSIGLDLDSPNFSLWQPLTWEEGTSILVNMQKANVDVVVNDSVSAMTPAKMLDVKLDETPPIGLLARLQSNFLAKFVGPLGNSQTAVIYINQVRSNIKTSKYDAGPAEDTSGGRALKFYSSLRLKLQRIASEKANITDGLTGRRDKIEICNVVAVQGVKNKIDRRQFHKAIINIRYGEGIDNIRSILDIAILRGLIKKNGGWYVYDGPRDPFERLNGIEVVRAYMGTHPDAFTDIQNQLVSYLSSGSGKLDTSSLTDEEIAMEQEAEMVDDASDVVAEES